MHDLKDQILQCFAQMPDKVIESYQHTWCDLNAKPVLDEPSATKQRSWDNPVVERKFAILLQHQIDIY